jgi:hypothetical protein
MAPREATGTFPDQYLTFDYESAVPLGVPPVAQDPVHDGIEGHGADHGEEGPSPSLVGDALNPVGTGTPAPAEPYRTVSNEAIDPLSIDPTSALEQQQQHPDTWGNGPVAEEALETTESRPPMAVGRPFSSGSSVGAPVVSMDLGNSVEDTASEGPISTGSTYLNAFTAPHSPRSLAVSPLTTQSRVGTLRGLLPFQSVLDATLALDSDEDVLDHDAPALESTFDSVASSVDETNGNAWGESHLVEESFDDQQSHAASDDSSLQHIFRNAAFDGDESAPATPLNVPTNINSPLSPNSIMLSFGEDTTVNDLKYFAERGCIVPLLEALNTTRLVTLGTRMLADYAKMAHRRAAVASNRRILQFVQHVMLSSSVDGLGREYAVETIRSLTATEASDAYLMQAHGLLSTLALVARGGPFARHVQEHNVVYTVPLASEKAQLHACIAIMNLSCGKGNKIEIAKIPNVLESMRDVMLNSADEARLKATTCVKNLSNADANDAALLGTPGLVEALGHVAAFTCSPETGATPCTTNACLSLMNLSISKANKHRVFRTRGVMDALMAVLERTTAQGSSTEARIKACSALSNLAIGYDNKIPMFQYPGFVESILNVIQTDSGEARTKACSILWSFAAEMKNQIPVVQRQDILPVLVQVAEEDGTTEARFKCVAALTLLAESLQNAVPLLETGALPPLMDILHHAGPDPTQWKGQTASWCVGFLMNIAQSDEAVLTLRESGVVELLAPLLTLDHYQSLKAAMAVTFCCRYDEGDECYDLLRKTENVIPKIICLLHNTLSGRGGNGYKYGVFTLRSSVGCIAALASGPDFMKERIATGPVYESLLRVVTDFCVDGGTPGAIVGGGRDDALSATLAIRALQSLTGHLIPIAGSSTLPFGPKFDDRLLTALEEFEKYAHPDLKQETRDLATDAKIRIQGGRKTESPGIKYFRDNDGDVDMDVASFGSHCCVFEQIPGFGEDFLQALTLPSLNERQCSPPIAPAPSIVENESDDERPVRTFLLSEISTGRRFVVPSDPSGGRAFNDKREWCYRRGRFCTQGETPDPNYAWTAELQMAYEAILVGCDTASSSSSSILDEGIQGR